MQLLSKITVGGQELQNRVVFAALTRARCEHMADPYDILNHVPTETMGDYYEQRASAGLVLTEATAISEEAGGWPHAGHMHRPEHMEAWKKIVDRVHARGAKFYIQMWHMGRQTHSSFHPSTNRIVGASDVKLSGQTAKIDGTKVPAEVPHALTIEEIEELKKDYVNCAKLCKEAGFDGLELHGANGYLLNLFLDASTNNRTDKYGGSIENRCRLVLEVFDTLVASGIYPSDRIGIKISPNGTYGEMGHEENFETFVYLASELNKRDIAFIEVMDGLGFGYHEKCKPVTCMDVRKVFDKPIIANVGLTKEIAEGMIRSGAADMASFGRPYMSNPDLVERFTNDWPLAPVAEYMDWWHTEGAKGYSDFPVYEEPSSAISEC